MGGIATRNHQLSPHRVNRERTWKGISLNNQDGKGKGPEVLTMARGRSVGEGALTKGVTEIFRIMWTGAQVKKGGDLTPTNTPRVLHRWAGRKFSEGDWAD